MKEVNGSTKFLRPEEVARILEVSSPTIRRWCNRGELGTKVLGRWRIDRDELPKVAGGWGDGTRSGT